MWALLYRYHRHLNILPHEVKTEDNVVCMVLTYSKIKDQPGKVANPARGQLNRENE